MIILVAVAAGAVLLTSNLGKSDADLQAEPTADPAQYLYVDYPVDEIVDITVENKSGTYTLYRTESASGEQAADESADMIWKLKGNEGVDIDQGDAGSLARYASYLYINEVITEDMSRKAEFGLEDYAAKVTVSFTDGETRVYYYGNQVPAEPAYYMYMEGEDKIFTVSSSYGYYMNLSAYDLYALAQIGLTANDITEVRLERDGQVVFHTKPAENILGLGGFDIVEPFWHMVNGDSHVKLCSAIESLSVEGVIDTSANLAKYGLDDPWGKLTVTGRNGLTRVFLVGDKLDDTYTACTFEGDGNIYKAYTATLGVFDYNTYQMVDKYLAMLNIANVDKVTLSGFGIDSVVLGIEKEPQFDENGEPKLNASKEQVYNNIFSKNGKVLGQENNEQGTWYYQRLIVVMSNTILTPEEFSLEGLEPVGSIVFDLSIDPGVYTVEFYQYNDDFYAVSVNGQAYLHKVADSEIRKMLAGAEDFLSGEIQKPY